MVVRIVVGIVVVVVFVFGLLLLFLAVCGGRMLICAVGGGLWVVGVVGGGNVVLLRRAIRLEEVWLGDKGGREGLVMLRVHDSGATQGKHQTQNINASRITE